VQPGTLSSFLATHCLCIDGFGNSRPALAGTFRRVERRIGALDQGLSGIARKHGGNADAQRETNGAVAVFQAELHISRLGDLCHAIGESLRRGSGRQEAELVASVASEDFAGSGGLRQPLNYGLQDLIAK
jgi:hypothetical protein